MDFKILHFYNIILIINPSNGRWISYKLDMNHDVNNRFNNMNDFKSKYTELYNYIQLNYNKLNEKNFKNIRNLKYLILNITSDCNMNCKYCYAKKFKKRTAMDSEIMIYTINKILENNKSKECLNVIFHGGEPLLEKNVIKKIINLYKNQNMNFIVQTNGKLLDEDFILFCKLNKVSLSLSVDGFKIYNNLSREMDENYLKNIIKNLEIMNNLDVNRGVISIINKTNVKDMIYNADRLIDLGINKFTFNLIYQSNTIEDNSLPDIEVLIEETKKLISHLFCLNNKQNYNIWGKYFERNIYALWKKMFYLSDDYMCLNLPCGAGSEVITVDEYGKVYPCSVYIDSDNYITDIWNFDFSNKIKHNFRDIKKIEKCRVCEFNKFCVGGGCPGFIKDSTGSFYGESFYCKYFYEIIKFLYFITLNSVDNKITKNF